MCTKGLLRQLLRTYRTAKRCFPRTASKPCYTEIQHQHAKTSWCGPSSLLWGRNTTNARLYLPSHHLMCLAYSLLWCITKQVNKRFPFYDFATFSQQTLLLLFSISSLSSYNFEHFYISTQLLIALIKQQNQTTWLHSMAKPKSRTSSLPLQTRSRARLVSLAHLYKSLCCKSNHTTHSPHHRCQ